ncbi:hypothetical protein [Salibacterium halotolerans]|uniref:Uncharacterized protein n=1 Tax=Salibacterium halotolerans TaxID=1884432 RepID=A0A1I5VIV8_9BACI|nr:hypothetical protein [Salibacterium halotolerans]SFQ07361.1 hypothetical protein SAMN05518683_11649 [Salibacterium halotolerans]
MKPIYMLGTVVMICLAVTGAAGAMFLFNTEETGTQKERTTEELAADLDEALGVDPPAEEKTPENNKTDSDGKETENSRTARQTPAADTENNKSLESRAVSSSESDWKQSARKSNAISLGPEEKSISVDELLQRIEE